MKTVQEYRVESSDSLTELVAIVNNLMAEGFRPIGNVSVLIGIGFYQALLKDKIES